MSERASLGSGGWKRAAALALGFCPSPFLSPKVAPSPVQACLMPELGCCHGRSCKGEAGMVMLAEPHNQPGTDSQQASWLVGHSP